MNLRRILLYLKIDAKSFMRGRSGPFFMIIFPIILILLFGSIFGGSATLSKTPLVVQNLDQGNASWQLVNEINSTGLFQVTVIGSNSNLSTYITHNGITDALLIPANFSEYYANGTIAITYLVDPSDQVSYAYGQVLLNDLTQYYNANLTGAKQVFLSEQPVVGKITKTVDYYIPGFIGFTILSGVFALIYQVPNYREKKIFRQLSFVGLTKSEWLASSVIFFTLTTFISDIVLVGVGVLVFHTNLTMTVTAVLLAGLIIFLGLISFLSIGLLSGLLTKEENSAALVGNVIFYPMLFLSGVFFPISDMPKFLQVFAEFLPLTYFIRALDNIMLFSDYPAVIIPIIFMAIAALVLFVIATFAATKKERL